MQVVLLYLTEWLTRHQLPCLVKLVFHIDCPACGLQRSVIELMQGNVMGSIILYPALLPILAFLLFVVINQTKQLVPQHKLLSYGLLSLFSLITLSYIYKLTL